MKYVHTAGLLCLPILALLFNSATAAPPTQPRCEGSVVEGCVGECGNPFVGSHLVTAEDVQMSKGKRRASFCLQINSQATNLCPSEDIRYQLSVNGKVKASGEFGYSFGDILNTGLISVAAREGDSVAVELEHFTENANIVCFLLGEARVDLGHVQ
jgi:hypothetical protein